MKVSATGMAKFFSLRHILCFAFVLTAIFNTGRAQTAPVKKSVPPKVSKVTDVLIPLEGFLVQGIPHTNVDLFPTDLVLKIEVKDRIEYFYVHKDAQEFIAKIHSEGLTINVVSNLPSEISEALAKELKINSLNSTLQDNVNLRSITDHALTSDILNPLLGAKLKSTLIITTSEFKADDSLMSQVIDSGPVFYTYPTYALVQSRMTMNTKNYLPDSEDTWRHELNKLDIVYSIINRSSLVVGKTADSAQSVLKKFSLDVLEVNGEALLHDRFKPQIYVFNISPPNRTTPFSFVTECQAVDAWTKAVVGKGSAEDCLHGEKVNYYWIDTSEKSCSAFTQLNALIKTSSVQNCLNKAFLKNPKSGKLQVVTWSSKLKGLSLAKIFEDSCDEASGPIDVSDSPNLKYFKSVLVKGNSATFDELMKLWYPDRQASVEVSDNSYFLKCMTVNRTMRAGSDGLIDPQCRPDTLYSWGPLAKLQNISQALVDKGSWEVLINPGIQFGGYRPKGLVYSTISAVATFEYGPVPIRFKVRSDIPMKAVTSPSQANNSGEITYYTAQRFEDFYLLDGTSIDSWSFGTPEQYDEIVRDIQRMITGKPAIFYTNDPQVNGYQTLENLDAWDGHRASLESLKQSLLTMIKQIVNGEGRIFYREGVCRNRRKHFETTKPTYINPVISEAQ
jgi:hypothetical protein